MKTSLCLVLINLKLTALTMGHTFYEPWNAVSNSLLILFPMMAKESPFTSLRYVKKTVMNRGHHRI